MQSALVGTVIVVSIITVEKLGPVQLPDPIPPFHIKSVDLVAVARASGGAVSRGPVTQARPFIAPGPKVSALSTSDDAEPSLPSGPGIELGANTAPQGGIPGALPLADSAARPSLPQQPTAVPDRPKPVQTT
ncbi:MAG TPA: hypothetical protein VEQ63_10380, partial [Bryobacteraceae bacterium]|nr:hypothetical protein [Bryobacteraceae bacterium]